MFLTGVWDLDLDWDRSRKLSWIILEVFIPVRLVKGKIGYV